MSLLTNSEGFLVGGSFPIVRPPVFAPESAQTSVSWPSVVEDINTAGDPTSTRPSDAGKLPYEFQSLFGVPMRQWQFRQTESGTPLTHDNPGR